MHNRKKTDLLFFSNRHNTVFTFINKIRFFSSVENIFNRNYFCQENSPHNVIFICINNYLPIRYLPWRVYSAARENISMAWCRTALLSVCLQWRYCILALSQRYAFVANFISCHWCYFTNWVIRVAGVMNYELAWCVWLLTTGSVQCICAWYGVLKMYVYISKPSVNSNWSHSPKTVNLGQNL